MKKFRWKDNHVISVLLKDGTFVLGQLLSRVHVAFFKRFSDDDKWEASAAESSELLFICPVMGQFFEYSGIVFHDNVRPKLLELPRAWIEPFHGGRKIVVWPGTAGERTILTLHARPGGVLVEQHIDRGVQPRVVIKASIDLHDDATIDGHETTFIRIYPTLNERLYLCKVIGRAVDPEKDLQFDRPLRAEYRIYMDMLARHGAPEDWGYSPKRLGETSGSKLKTNSRLVRVAINTTKRGFPFNNALDARHDLEDQIEERGIGEVVHATSSVDSMEIDVQLRTTRLRARLEKLIDQLGLSAFTELSTK